MECSTPGFPVPHHLPEFAQIHVCCIVMPSRHLILCHPLLLLPTIFSSITDFSSELAICIRWPTYWSFSISPCNEYLALISLKIDWFDLAVQGNLGNLLQHHSLKASILWHSAFLMVQLSKLYATIGKTIALTIRTFVGRIMFLLFNTVSRFVIAFLPRSNRLLISWLQSPSIVMLEPKKRKSVTTSTYSPSLCCKAMGPDAIILVFFFLFFFFFFFIFSFKLALLLSSFILIKRLFSSYSLSAIREVSSIFLRLLMLFPPILIPACSSSSLAFLMMYSEHRLNKEDENRQPCRTPFSIPN